MTIHLADIISNNDAVAAAAADACVSRWLIQSTLYSATSALVSLNLENDDLNHRNLRSMLKSSYTVCPCLSQLVSVQFAFAMCIADEMARNT